MAATISNTRARYIPELLETHVEELEFLWGQRRAALYSTSYNLRSFADLTERVEAHIQGLLAIPDVLVELLMPRLTCEDRDGVFAAACPLLRLGDPAITKQLLLVFANAQGAALAGLRDAFSFAPSGQFVMAIRELLELGDSAHAVAAAVILSNQRLLDPTSLRLSNLLQDENPDVVEYAWKAVTEADTRKPSNLPRPYHQALAHTDPKVRQAVLFSAAWSRQAWLLPAVRQLAVAKDQMGMACLAALGQAEDLATLLTYTSNLTAQTEACYLLARFGHPGVMEVLGKGMVSPDKALAAASGEAFTLITGVDINGERQQLPVSPEADEFEQEFADLVWMPDITKAQAYWQQHGKRLSTGSRWRQGINLDGKVSVPTLAQIDLQARWDACARAAQSGYPLASPPPIY